MNLKRNLPLNPSWNPSQPANNPSSWVSAPAPHSYQPLPKIPRWDPRPYPNDLPYDHQRNRRDFYPREEKETYRVDVLPDEVSFLLKENQRLKADISDLRETTDQLKVSLGALSKAMESMQAQLSSSQRANEGRNAAEMDLPPKAPPPPAQPLPPAPVTDPPSQPVAPPTIPPPRENRETASLKPPPPPLPPPRPPTTIVPITVPTIAAVQPASVAEPENPGPGIGVEYTLKAKGIPVLALPEKISVFFSTSGPVRFIEPEYDVQGKATQYLIVSFASAAALSAAIKMNSRKWPNTNKYVTVREVYFGGKQPPGCKTVRVSRLPVSITKERLEILFKDCGVISHVKFYSCCVKGITTVVALVDFLEEKSAYAAVRLSGSVVSKRTVRIFYFVSKSKGNEGAATTVLSKETNVSIKGTGRSLSSGAQLPEGKGQKRIRSRVRTSEHESDVYRGTEGGHAGEDGADGDGKEEGNSKEREADVDEQDIVQFLESTCSTQSTRADALVLIIHRICKEASTRRNFLRKGGTFLLLKWLVDEIRDKSFDEVSVRTRLPYVCDLGVSVAFFDVDDSTKSAINCHLEDFYNLLVAGKFVESVGPSQILQVLLLKLIDERTKRPNAI